MSPDDYLDWRFKFSQVWHQDDRFMALLKPEHQWRLHDYFQFDPFKQRDEALAWYFTVQACNRTIEDEALLAFQRLQLVLHEINERKNQLPLPIKGRRREIIVRAVVRPEPDLDLFVEGLIELASQGRESDRDKHDPGFGTKLSS